ncbi:MAG: multiprotein bridging factor aMBF1 [Candidatus Altiarchaeota archaeon]
MICEICGKFINDGVKVTLEGGEVTACRDCSSVGEVVKTVSLKPKAEKKPVRVVNVKPEFKIESGEDLVEEYARRIKESREKKGLRQEELARMVNEPSSLIHRIESSRIEPNPSVLKKLEKALGIRLLVPHSDDDEVKMSGGESKPLTLGDMIVVKKKK